MVTFFKLVCMSFLMVTISAIIAGFVFSWKAFAPRMSQERRDEYSDRVYECAQVARWTIVAAGVSGIVWGSLVCIQLLEIC